MKMYIRKQVPVMAIKYTGGTEGIDGFDFYSGNGQLYKSMTIEETKTQGSPRAMVRKAFIFINANGMQGRQMVDIGDYILIENNTKMIMKEKDFLENFEELPFEEIEVSKGE